MRILVTVGRRTVLDLRVLEPEAPAGECVEVSDLVTDHEPAMTPDGPVAALGFRGTAR